MKMKEYTTGEFAKLAQVTKRTLQFYDRKNLLKPSSVSENGYRKYTMADLEQLQKILMFKQLGFSLDEIAILLLDSRKDLLNSLQVQKHLVSDRISHLESVRDSLDLAIRQIRKGSEDPQRLLLELIKIIRKDDQLVEQYKNANNLRIRTSLHQKYSTSETEWFDWVLSQISLSGVNRILEVGCGNGLLWKNCRRSLRNRDIFLSDLSEGMIEEARELLSQRDFSFMVFNAEKIPFRRGYFDAVIANHMLFYLQDLQAGLSEICRVLSAHGTLYATAYGADHMKEVTELVQEFDPEIYLSSERLSERFGRENGEEILKKRFRNVRYLPFEDALQVDDAKDLADYILSCHGNQNERLKGRYNEFIGFLQAKIDEKGSIHITKDAGMFIACQPLTVQS